MKITIRFKCARNRALRVWFLFLREDSVNFGGGKSAVLTEFFKPHRLREAWLNTQAEQAHINFSGVLQEALKERLDMR
jgi:hypothetical protein